MAKVAAKGRRASRGSDEERSAASSALISEAAGLFLLGLAALAALALGSYSPQDSPVPLPLGREVANQAGPVGASLAFGLLWLMDMGAVVFVASTAFLGGSLVLGQGIPPLKSRFWAGSGLLILSVACLAPLLGDRMPAYFAGPTGGLLGSRLVGFEQQLFGRSGALLVNGLMLVVGALSVTGISTGAALGAAGAGIRSLARLVRRTVVYLWGLARSGLLSALALNRKFLFSLNRGWSSFVVWREQRARRSRVAGLRPPVASSDVEVSEQSAKGRRATAGRAVRATRDGGPQIVDHIEQRERERKPEQETFEFSDRAPSQPFQQPDSAIFARPPQDSRKFDRNSLLMNSRILEKKLADFGVQGTVVRVHPGPVITMYEYEPAAGIKVNKIVGLTDDLAMALRAISIRIIAPLPGKNVVGIEVPNPVRETVYLRTLLDSDGFRKNESTLTVAMGMDIFGNPVISDLAKMPHLLVAGSTGTGKSVFLNAFLCSLLCRASPDELKLLLIDPKLLELSIYEGIPHLIADVVTNPKRAAAALQGIVRKMEERYLMMGSVQVRNIDQFNAKAREEIAKGNTAFELRGKSADDSDEPLEIEWAPLPYIVVVIDELADLMVMVAKDVEESLQRLAQMARAAGIHLVLATQRPSVDVLTGVIKANFPSRVSFQVSSAIDSRTILDQKGAESLLGLGDMLFLPPRTALLDRLHAPFVSEKEVVELVSFLRDQGKPVFDEELVRFTEEGPEFSEESDGEVDEMFDPAVAIVAETRNASISYIQRRLKIGYNRSARIIEQMERDGMVGPQVGNRPREVFLRNPNEE
ncbi:MAG: DNA translocase FtsK 4TM domain-containing protein [Myxococcota bacterium]|nr:DNA translocase FtsK 4TM domain-containing protein [Myxococcota bacterium]